MVFNPLLVDGFQALSEGNAASSGETLECQMISTEQISALKAVYGVSKDDVAIADSSSNTTAQMLGISKTATSGAAETLTVLKKGKVEDVSFSFPINAPLFLGTSGNITNISPTSGFVVRVGHSLGAGAIYINIEPPIELC